MKNFYYHSAILDICTEKHLSVDEIYQKILVLAPGAGYSTIYRNVEELEKKGLLRKISGITTKSLYEKISESHSGHFIDEKTGEIIDIKIPEEVLMPYLPESGEVRSFDLRIFGTLKKD